jgi:molecular chaperone GrpE
MSQHDREPREEHEPVVVRDRRRIDPETGAVRASEAEADAAPAPDSRPRDSGADPAASLAAAELAAQVAERTADLQRITAEYANYRRRVERDREAVLVTARTQFVGELLTVLDDIDRAEAHGDLTGPFKAVADKVTSVVQKFGLESFGLIGEPFDPSVHEAVQHDTGEGDGPTVPVLAVVLRKGYRMADRVLRPAMVTVVDRPDDGTTGEPSTD